MFIARAKLKSKDYGITELAIYADTESEEEYNDRMTNTEWFAHVNKPIADDVMRIAATKNLPVSFVCNGTEYELIKYSTNCYERYYNKYRDNHVVERIKVLPLSCLNVYTQRCRCFKCFRDYGFDNIVNICGVIPLKKNKQIKVEIDIKKCTRCNKLFVDNQSLNEYEKKYGALCITKKPVYATDYLEYDDDSYYNHDSILSRNGYLTKYDDAYRTQILINMIENGISKTEIVDKLSEFIYFRSGRNPYAAIKWKRDLAFVNEYKLGSQPVIYFE